MALNESVDARFTIPDLANVDRAASGAPGKNHWVPEETRQSSTCFIAYGNLFVARMKREAPRTGAQGHGRGVSAATDLFSLPRGGRTH